MTWYPTGDPWSGLLETAMFIGRVVADVAGMEGSMSELDNLRLEIDHLLGQAKRGQAVVDRRCRPGS